MAHAINQTKLTVVAVVYSHCYILELNGTPVIMIKHNKSLYRLEGIAKVIPSEPLNIAILIATSLLKPQSTKYSILSAISSLV